ncbi:hypothetical protein GCM10027285_04170 [Oleiagrimonas citrea]|jgi:hypothetical protein|nr:hypothetical protein BTJ49_02665 [Oleiagrimonas sp. MCCC 1A03011]
MVREGTQAELRGGAKFGAPWFSSEAWSVYSREFKGQGRHLDTGLREEMGVSPLCRHTFEHPKIMVIA